MRRRIVLLLCTIVVFIFSNCGEERISRTYPCRFLLYTQYHNPSKVLTAITSANYPVKVSVYKNTNGSYRVAMTNVQDETETQTLTTQIETYAYSSGILLGANDCIIICLNSYDQSRIAYDGQCPNCIHDYGTTSYPLKWTDNAMQVKCSKCKRVYDLNYGNIISGSAGDRLMEYAVSYDGTRLYVGN